MAFQTQALQNVIRSRIDELFSRYNFKLFIKAHAIFIKAFYIDGGKQDRNNPSDILHLLYLDEGDKLVSSDKIFETVKEAAEEFQYLKLEQNKKLDELINNNE